MSTLPKNFLTPDEYLEIERKAEYKSEYYDGRMVAMAGVSIAHDEIKSQLEFLIKLHLRGGNCGLYTSDVRVMVPDRRYFYPDLTVVCGDRQVADSHADTLLNPILLVEVLSPSTERLDRGKKSRAYRSIPSLREYLIIAQDRPAVELRRPSPDGGWTLTHARGLDASIELESIGYTLQLRELYEPVFPV